MYAMPKLLIIAFGTFLILFGLLGLTVNPFTGAHGFFETDRSGNLLYLLCGFSLFFVTLISYRKCILWLRTLGVGFIMLALGGLLFLPAGGRLLGLVHTNTADYVLYLLLASAFVGTARYVNLRQPRKPAPPADWHHEGSAQ